MLLNSFQVPTLKKKSFRFVLKIWDRGRDSSHLHIDELVENEICIILIFLLLGLITAACPCTRWRYPSKTRRRASNNQSEQKPFQSCDDYWPIQSTNPGDPDRVSTPGHCPSHRW